MQLSLKNQCWLDDFYQFHGRAPRILHMGNIANNAYNNAKLMNEAGFDCDVISHDYYHAMGAPEWEDADLLATPKNMFDPNWSTITPLSYQRPRWFAQGPTKQCIDYLVARRAGAREEKAQRLWKILGFRNRTAYVRNTHDFLLNIGSGGMIPSSCKKIVRYLGNPLPVVRMIIQRSFATFRNILTSLSGPLKRKWPEIKPLFAAGKQRLESVEKWLVFAFYPSIWFSGSSAFDCESLAEFESLAEKYACEFPERTDILSDVDLLPYSKSKALWEPLLAQYDFVIGYATSGVFPLICDRPFFAFEHGTIRDIPYESSSRGRLCALTYRLAKHCFVTNTDCVKSAQFLCPGRFTVINHPYDEDRPLQVVRDDQSRMNWLKKLECDFLVFHPTRQDWVKGTGYADKANDEFWKAIGMLKKDGFRVGVIATDWGKNVAESRELTRTLGIEASVEWIPAQATLAFEKTFAQVDMVADQFFLGAFGGILPKALASSRAVVSYLDFEELARVYPEPPPVLVARTAAEIALQIKTVLSDRDLKAEIERQGRSWVQRFHSKRETLNKIVTVFRET